MNFDLHNILFSNSEKGRTEAKHIIPFLLKLYNTYIYMTKKKLYSEIQCNDGLND